METTFIIYLLLSCTITSLIWFIYVTKLKGVYNNIKIEYDRLNISITKEVSLQSNIHQSDLQNKIKELELSISETKFKSFNDGYDKARGEFSIKVFPYKEEHKQGDDGWIINDIYHEILIGYQYQLFLNGIPILQPAIIVEEVLTEQKREVDYNKIDIALNAVEAKLLPIVAGSKGLIKLIKK